MSSENRQHHLGTLTVLSTTVRGLNGSQRRHREGETERGGTETMNIVTTTSFSGARANTAGCDLTTATRCCERGDVFTGDLSCRRTAADRRPGCCSRTRYHTFTATHTHDILKQRVTKIDQLECGQPPPRSIFWPMSMVAKRLDG